MSHPSHRMSAIGRPPAALVDTKLLSANLAVLATAGTLVALFTISPVTMEHFGLAYITSGGGILSKFHPATFLAVLAFALRCGASPRPGRTAWRLVTGDKGVVVLLAAICLAAVSAIAIAKTPVTPLVDTFVLPVLCFLLLRDLDMVVIKWLALLVLAILGVNAVMGLVEFLRGTHFVALDIPDGVSSDPTRGDVVFDWRAQLMQDWRATALLGHPLVNGLVIGATIMCLAAPGARWLPLRLKGALIALLAASMFAFGARASLVMSFAFAAVLAVWQSGEALARGARIGPRSIAMTLLVIGLAIGGIGILTATGFFDRTVERFASDAGSAETRFTMFELFQPFGWSDLLLGPDQNVVATWQRLYGLEFGIESTWVGLALTYGLIVTLIIVAGLLAFSRSVVRACGRGTTLVLAFYFISVSGTASMSGKTTTFAMAIVLILLLLQTDEKPRPLRSALGLETT